MRYGQHAPQLDPGSETRRVSADRFCYGIKRLVLGLAKKAIIADQLALIYAKVASVPAATLPAPILVLGYTAYMMQLYFDFSGYSDMAIGIGEFFGITLPENLSIRILPAPSANTGGAGISRCRAGSATTSTFRWAAAAAACAAPA